MMQDRLFIWMNFVPSTLTNSNQCESRFTVKFIDALLRSSDASIVKHKQNVPAQSNCACFCKWSFIPTKGFLDQYWLHYSNNYHKLCNNYYNFSLNEIFVLQAVEILRRMNGVTHPWTFKFVHYSQSNACDHVNSSSVSYAAGVLFSKP